MKEARGFINAIFLIFQFGLRLHRMVHHALQVDGWKDNYPAPDQFGNERQVPVCFINLSTSFLIA